MFFVIFSSDDDKLQDSVVLSVWWAHYNVRYGRHNPMAKEKFLLQKGNNNHTGHILKTDDKWFFEYIAFHNILEQVDKADQWSDNVRLLLSDLTFRNVLLRCWQPPSIDLRCWLLSKDGCSLQLKGTSRFLVLEWSIHQPSFQYLLKHLCIKLQPRRNDILQHVEFRMPDIPKIYWGNIWNGKIMFMTSMLIFLF